MIGYDVSLGYWDLLNYSELVTKVYLSIFVERLFLKSWSVMSQGHLGMDGPPSYAIL